MANKGQSGKISSRMQRRAEERRKKRLIILNELANQFKPGKTYAEQEVNDRILKFFDDYCLIRREMIVFGIMTRKNHNYRLPEKKEN